MVFLAVVAVVAVEVMAQAVSPEIEQGARDLAGCDSFLPLCLSRCLQWSKSVGVLQSRTRHRTGYFGHLPTCFDESNRAHGYCSLDVLNASLGAGRRVDSRHTALAFSR